MSYIMESLLTRLVTYKLMGGSGFAVNFFNQPIEKLLFSLLLFISIVGSTLYILHRTFFQNRFSISKGSKHKSLEPQTLIDMWINQNQNLCDNIMSLCVAFINAYADRVKVREKLLFDDPT